MSRKRQQKTLVSNGRIRIRNTPTFHHNLLRSDKSTYFYKHKLNQSFLVSAVPLGLMTLALCGLGCLMLSPVDLSNYNKAYASEDMPVTNARNVSVPTSGVALTIDTVLPEDNTIVQQATGGTQAISVNFTVGANDIDEYKVFVQADSINLMGSTYQDRIASISSNNIAFSQIGQKEWGYAVAKGANADAATLNYRSIQTGVTTPADSVEAASGSKLNNITQPYTLAFAANLDGAKPDHYKSNITLSVTASATEIATIEPTGFGWAKNMQEMTPTLCSTMPVGETGTLRDTRDNKVYWVAKLADDNCWMTQNLDLDLSTSRTLTPEDSDLLADWTPSNSTQSSSLSTSWWPNEKESPQVRSWNPGMYLYSKINADWTKCTDKIKTFANCDLTIGWTLVDNNYTPYTDISTTILDTTSQKYDAHYLIGNYCSWDAATADGYGTIVDDVATGSICPKGWKLPLQSTGDQSFKNMVDKNSLTPSAVRLAPVYFIPGGYSTGIGMYNAGSVGYYWTSSTNIPGRDDGVLMGRTFLIAKTSVSTNGASHRYVGGSVRCVAR